MKVCLLGSGVTSLTLAKTLVNKGISVDVFSGTPIRNIDKSRFLGISKTNIDFFNRSIININKFLWKINKIDIFTNNLKNEKVLNFENKNQLFSTIRNNDLYNHLIKDLKKNKLFKIKKNFTNQLLEKKEYELIINCDFQSFLTKKFFFKKIYKDYNSYAHTAIIDHKRKINNNIATQIFTQKGPLAFLPISEKQTSIVYSARGSKDLDLKKCITKYNPRYEIYKISEISNFKLNSLNLRKYYHNNILAFGDLLHKLHPLAGQGFNMTMRDINILIKIIKFKLDHGLQLDSSVCIEFEKNTKHRNYLFSNAIDLIYEFFDFENKTKNPILSKSLQFLSNQKIANNFFTKFADKGLVI